MKICIYGASGTELDEKYFEDARALGRLIAQGGHSLIFGGGSGGLMGACAQAALALGADICGVAPRFFDEPGVLLEGCTRFVFTDTMSQRKQIMEDGCDAFIALPGGIGTFEEFFETLTLKQLGRHSKPMALLNTLDYYRPLCAMLEQAAAGGFMSRRCMELFTLCQSPEEALARIQEKEPLQGGITRLADYTK